MNENKVEVNGLKLIITIVDRKVGKKVVKLFEKNGCYFHKTLLGKGTVSQEIYEYLGLGEIEKDVVLSIADEKIVPKLLELLVEKLHFDLPGKGIACSIPISSIDGISSLKRILQMEVR